MNGLLEIRPVSHRMEERLQLQVLVAALMLACVRAPRWNLERVGLELLSSRATLEGVGWVEFELPGRKTKADVYMNGDDGGESSEARRVLRVGERVWKPPQPPRVPTGVSTEEELGSIQTMHCLVAPRYLFNSKRSKRRFAPLWNQGLMDSGVNMR